MNEEEYKKRVALAKTQYDKRMVALDYLVALSQEMGMYDPDYQDRVARLIFDK